MTKSCGDGVSRNASITIVLGVHIFISRTLRMKNKVCVTEDIGNPHTCTLNEFSKQYGKENDGIFSQCQKM